MSPQHAALAETVRALGGHVISVPGVWPIRFDVAPSEAEALCDLLQRAGWSPHPRGINTQLEHGFGFRDVLLYEIAAPKSER